MAKSVYFNRFFASRMTKSSIQSGAERPEACLMSVDRYLGVRHSLSVFFKFFKAHTGLTPSEYRNA